MIQQFYISAAFLSGIISGDTSTMDDHEIAAMALFEEQVAAECGPGHFEIADDGAFVECDATGIVGPAALLIYLPE